MQLNLTSFENSKSKNDRIDEAIASSITLKGLDKIPALQEILQDIFVNYELKNGVFKLIDEICSHCDAKLKRKDIYDKEISLPGGLSILLSFYRYSCTTCKKKIDRKLGSWFSSGERYSSNVKSDAIRIYLSNLSSFDVVRDELETIYKKSFSKRTIRKWLSNIGFKAENTLSKERNFSGHFIYDEEYMKVFTGDVGVKGSKLTRIEVYLLLFRDAITGNVILTLSDSLNRYDLMNHWMKFTKWTIKNNIPFHTLTTDGKREYPLIVEDLNNLLKLKIKHSYCIFHFKKNLFEVSNKLLFGVTTTKKELPLSIKNQIKELEKVVDSTTSDEFDKNLELLKAQKQTFSKPLQGQIKRLNTYKEKYKLHIKFPFLRTTNAAEHWFGMTKPEKVKKGFKTKKGLLKVLQALAVKITNKNWKLALKIPKDITDATNLLVAIVKKEKYCKKPA